MFIKFFLILNHMMNIVVVMLMTLLCYRKWQGRVEKIAKQSANML
jgi:hypothetical protein